MLKAVIFDLDGVIMKFKLDSHGIKREVIARLEEKGLTPKLLNPTDPFSKIKESSKNIFRSQGRNDEWVDAVMRDVEKIPMRHEVEAAKVAEMLPRVSETLAYLRDRGLRLAVFTYNHSVAAEIALIGNGLKEYFELIAARDSVPRPKPNPLHLDFVLKSLMVEKDEAIVVGDSEMDIKPCKELGVLVVAISTGVRSADYLRRLNPDFLINDLSELKPIVDSLGSA